MHLDSRRNTRQQLFPFFAILWWYGWTLYETVSLAIVSYVYIEFETYCFETSNILLLYCC